MLPSRIFVIYYTNFLTDISPAGYFLTRYYDHLRSGYDQISFPYGNNENFLSYHYIGAQLAPEQCETYPRVEI